MACLKTPVLPWADPPPVRRMMLRAYSPATSQPCLAACSASQRARPGFCSQIMPVFGPFSQRQQRAAIPSLRCATKPLPGGAGHFPEPAQSHPADRPGASVPAHDLRARRAPVRDAPRRYPGGSSRDPARYEPSHHAASASPSSAERPSRSRARSRSGGTSIPRRKIKPRNLAAAALPLSAALASHSRPAAGSCAMPPSPVMWGITCFSWAWCCPLCAAALNASGVMGVIGSDRITVYSTAP